MERRRFLFSSVEKITQMQPIPIEPGQHVLGTNFFSDFEKGDLNGHPWNKAVERRIASYGYSAPSLILTIDSLAPDAVHSFASNTKPAAEVNWVTLPARPRRLNKSGSVYAVAGDSNHYNLPQIFTGGVEDVPQALQEKADDLMQTLFLKDAGVSMGQMLGETVLIKELLEMNSLRKRRKSSIKKTVSDHLPSSPTINRRTALKGLGAGLLTASPMYQQIVGMGASFAPTESLKDALEQIDNLGSHRIFPTTWLDGRTALLIAKAKAVAQLDMQELQGGQSAIILGTSHEYREKYLRDKDNRDKAIVEYAKIMIDAGKDLYAFQNSVQAKDAPPWVINAVLDYVSRITVFKITDPGGPDFQPSFPSQIDKYVSTVNAFNCVEVLEATKSLRQ